MTEEEKKAIEILKDNIGILEGKLTIKYTNYNTVKAFNTILNLIEKLQKENEELKKDYYNVINKIENKIDILDIAISECIYIDDDDKAYKKAVLKDKLCLLNQKRALQELLEGRE